MSDDDLALLLFLSTYVVQNGHPPNFSEVSVARGMTRHEVKSTIRRLRAEGHMQGLYSKQFRHLMAVPAGASVGPTGPQRSTER